jgi:hypothetical protein
MNMDKLKVSQRKEYVYWTGVEHLPTIYEALWLIPRSKNTVQLSNK